MLVPAQSLTVQVEAIGKSFYFIYAGERPLGPVRLKGPQVQVYEIAGSEDGLPPLRLQAKVERGGYLKINWTEPGSEQANELMIWHQTEWQEAFLPIKTSLLKQP